MGAGWRGFFASDSVVSVLCAVVALSGIAKEQVFVEGVVFVENGDGFEADVLTGV